MTDGNLFEKNLVTKQKGDVVFCEYEPGNTLFFVQEGVLRLTKVVSGKEKTLANVGPGEIVGEMSVLEGQPRSATCVALTDMRMLELNNTNFANLVRFKPEIGIKLLKILASRVRDQRRKLKIIRLPDDESKVIDTFLMLDENKFAEENENEDRRQQTFAITTSGVASWAGISEDNCALVLKQLEKSGKISMTEDKITVYNLHNFRLAVESKRKSSNPN